MWNPAYEKSNPAAVPVQTVKARWGSRPSADGRWKGYEPDWHILVIKPDPADRSYPYWVEGWMPDHQAQGEAGTPFIWKVSDLTDPRYDLTEAVVIQPEVM